MCYFKTLNAFSSNQNVFARCSAKKKKKMIKKKIKKINPYLNLNVFKNVIIFLKYTTTWEKFYLGMFFLGVGIPREGRSNPSFRSSSSNGGRRINF